MHVLDIASWQPEQAVSVASATYLRLDRCGLRAGQANTAIANYNDYVWVFGKNYCTQIEISKPCVVHLESPGEESPPYGPFPEVHLVGPSITFGPRFQERLACYDCQMHQWLACREGKYYDAVVIESV